jgi:hypothetical protein
MRHFQAYELVDELLYNRMGDDCLKLFEPEALIALDDFEDFFGRPVVVNNWHAGGALQHRGYRPHAVQVALGTVKTISQHELGNAFDCTIHDIDAETARQRILENQDNSLLVRITRMESGVPWVHFDLKELPEGVQRIHLFTA